MQLLLRPSLRHSAPIAVLAVLGVLCAVALAAGLLAVRNWAAAVGFLAAAIAIGGSTWAYFAHATLGVDGEVVFTTNLFGIASRCNAAELARIELRYTHPSRHFASYAKMGRSRFASTPASGPRPNSTRCAQRCGSTNRRSQGRTVRMRRTSLRDRRTAVTH